MSGELKVVVYGGIVGKMDEWGVKSSGAVKPLKYDLLCLPIRYLCADNVLLIRTKYGKQTLQE